MAGGFAEGGRPVCGFCNAPWTEDMIRIFNISSSGGCDTCGYGATKSASIDITCEKCERVIYQKEYRHDDC